MEEPNATAPRIPNELNQIPDTAGVWKTPPDTVVASKPLDATDPIPSTVASDTQKIPPKIDQPTPVIPAKPHVASPATPVQISPPPLAQKKGKGGLRILSMVFGLLILVIIVTLGLIFADDKGLIKTGISPLFKSIPLSEVWNGLSANPSTASAQMTSALRNQAGFSYSGSFKGYGTSGESLSSDQSCVATSATACVPDPLLQNLQFSLKVRGSDTNLETILNDAGVNITTARKVVNGALYTSSLFGATTDGGIQAEAWQKSDSATGVTVDVIKDRLGSLLVTASFIGNELVGTLDAYHFRAAISGKDVPFWMTSSSVTGVINWIDSHGSLDLWVSRQSHLPVKITASLTSPDKKVISIDAHYVGTHEQEITAPVSVIEAGVAPDQTRKKDLQKIADALNLYFKDKGTYPTSSGVEHLDQPTANVVVALVPTYLTAMPADPTASHYYGYTSNGTTYELSAVLDDATDKDGVTVGALTLYLIKSPSN